MAPSASSVTNARRVPSGESLHPVMCSSLVGSFAARGTRSVGRPVEVEDEAPRADVIERNAGDQLPTGRHLSVALLEGPLRVELGHLAVGDVESAQAVHRLIHRMPGFVSGVEDGKAIGGRIRVVQCELVAGRRCWNQ